MTIIEILKIQHDVILGQLECLEKLKASVREGSGRQIDERS